MSEAIDAAIDAALAARDYAHAAGLYDRLELDVATAGHAHPAPAEHLLCLLAADDLQAARFLWHRLHLAPGARADGEAGASASASASVSTSASAPAAWALARALLSRDRPAFFAAAAAAHWPARGRAGALAAAVVDGARRGAADAVERAYGVVSRARVARLVGLDGADLAQFCVRRGWRLGEGDDAFVEIAVAQDARDELRLRARQEEERQMRGEDDEANRIAQAAARGRAFDELRMLTKQLVRLQTTT